MMPSAYLSNVFKHFTKEGRTISRKFVFYKQGSWGGCPGADPIKKIVRVKLSYVEFEHSDWLKKIQ